MNLQDVIPLLVERKLLDPSLIVGSEVAVEDMSRRNRNLRVVCSHGPSFFLKQADQSDSLSRASIRLEAYYYHLFAALRPPITPQFHFFDQARDLLAIEYFTETQTVAQYLDARPDRSQTRIAEALGIAVARYQPLGATPTPAGPWPVREVPWALRFMLPAPELLRTATKGQLEVIRLVQSNTGVMRGLSLARAAYAGTALVHGDLRWDNVLILDRSLRLSLIDWELASVGDPAWDVGTVFSNFLARSLRFMQPDHVDAEGLRLAFQARLPHAQREMVAFWRGYNRSRELNPDQSKEILERSALYAGAKLLQSAFEWSQAESLSPMAACFVQLGLNIIERPTAVPTAVLGLDAGRFS